MAGDGGVPMPFWRRCLVAILALVLLAAGLVGTAYLLVFAPEIRLILLVGSVMGIWLGAYLLWEDVVRPLTGRAPEP